MQHLEEQNFDSYVKSACFSLIGFYNPQDTRSKKMLDLLNDMENKYQAMQFGLVDTAKNPFVSKYGITPETQPILVIFTSILQPVRAISEFKTDAEIIQILFEEHMLGPCADLDCDANAN